MASNNQTLTNNVDAIVDMDMGHYIRLQDGDISLSPEEIAAGWHFCHDWDYMLIHTTWPENDGCLCGKAASS